MNVDKVHYLNGYQLQLNLNVSNWFLDFQMPLQTFLTFTNENSFKSYINSVRDM